LRGIGKPNYGYSVFKLLEELAKLCANIPRKHISYAKTLDQYYTPARYPDAWAEGSPYEYYMLDSAKQAIDYCSKILECVKNKWLELSKEEERLERKL